ncbi:uncharacterized protein LOC131666816 [Phymastichus coffea]|uniref:uncharacterized protein LOC131666816 n=1 Tax=Phymastichus coffea TaxID=108790 RepID=UPI00273CCA57|nr:uncharacterized protein LOC131666816 [Phymastichus coffea]
MTRFTRAKGSKSSNERVPNEGTPWHIMKQQLEEALQMQQISQNKTKSARQLLKEKDDAVYYAQSLGNISTDWAEFENSKVDAVKNSKIEKKPKGQQKKIEAVAKKYLSEHKGSAESASTNKIAGKDENIVSTIDKKQKNNTKSDNPTEDYFAKDSNDTEDIDKKKKYKAIELSKSASKDTTVSKQKVYNKLDESNTKLSKRQKRNKKKQDQINEPQNEASNINMFNVEGNDWNNSVEIGKRRKIDDNRDGQFASTACFDNKSDKWSRFDFKNFRRFGNNVPKKFQRKVAKNKDDRSHQRRKLDNNILKVTINGMDVEIVKYDGFPVKKDDAERLKELRQKLVLKGIPESEINAAMKLERRKCEKVLARIRRQVCFHCRKAGHNLSDCPELGKEEAGTGICFKCGSTEHTHFECKVTKSDDYRYAKCFICREQGHIAKQCPDNPKGLFPDGGCCKICGDVTHLKKDCPDLIKQKEEISIVLDTIKDSNLESLDSNIVTKPPLKTPVKKIVKF